MVMESRISVITLGVADVGAAAAFYGRVGLVRSRESDGSVAFFQLGGGLVLALFGREDLAQDQGLASHSPPGGMSIGYNTRSMLEADKLIAAFVASGGTLIREPARTFWGGYSGYVADPDGHVWEIVHNPHWRLDDEGHLTLPDSKPAT
ncbi:VOC family protein [Terrihabitans sp. B22-R8]|uniref:VOC family protein n=1 Tax=Terrihabitans sp. B22-R8 TaxID=3425128 RepID=UPI00403D1FAB